MTIGHPFFQYRTLSGSKNARRDTPAKFAAAYPDIEFVQQVAAQILWDIKAFF